jgi:UPF0755 protein
MLNTRFMGLLGVIIIILIGLGYFFYGLQPTLNKDTSIEFKIAKGEGFREIGAHLSKEELVKSISVFKLYSFLTGKATKFKPGVYDLTYKMSVPEIVNLLSAGGANEVNITIPEGSTVKDIDYLLSGSLVVEAGEINKYLATSVDSLSDDFVFLKNITSLEGFLFPDTYRFEIGSEPGMIIRKMLSNFEDKVWEDLKGRDDWYGDLILASYLEKEVPDYEDRRVVAGILFKRLGANVPLQVDATVIYAKCGGGFLNCEDSERLISSDDLKNIVSTYNTYKRQGWTPTPISNPGEEAVKAAINPKPTPYWYYLSAKEDGRTIFSRNLDEHNINRQKYL